MELIPRGRQSLAVPAPGCKELYEPGLAAEHLIRILVSDEAVVKFTVELHRVHIFLVHRVLIL